MGERFIMYYYSSGENKLGRADTDIMSGLEILPEDAVYVLIQSLLCRTHTPFVFLFLKNPRSSNYEILCTATYLFCTSDVCLQAAGMPALIV